MAVLIREADTADSAALLEIYRPFVEKSAVSFETELPSREEFAARIANVLARWSWLVAVHGERCIGYAYASAHAERRAYQWSINTSVYVDPDFRRQGIGRSLYRALFEACAAKGYCNAYAGITLPNDGSVALHRAAGFEPVGVFRSAGRKFGRWHDVSWWQRRLRDMPPA